MLKVDMLDILNGYGGYNWGVLPAPFYGFNNNILTPISSSYFDWYFQFAGPEYAFVEPPYNC
jgi:hypothetical protein